MMTDYIKISPAVWDNARLPFLGPVASLAYIMLVFLSAETGGEVSDKEAAKQWGRFGIEMDEMKTVIKALESDGLIGRENGYITVTDFEKIVKSWEQKKLSLEEVLDKCDMSESTFYRRLRELRMRK